MTKRRKMLRVRALLTVSVRSRLRLRGFSSSHTSALWLFKILHDRFMAFRNRVFHNESICWNKNRVTEIHNEIIEVIGCINKDMPNWLAQLDRVPAVSSDIIQIMDWKN